MPTIPSLFVSHGSPMLAIEDGPAHRFLKTLGEAIPRPRAILVASAHWETAIPTLSHAAQPATIHDFGRFDERLFELVYPVPGAPEVASRGAALLSRAGFVVERDAERGLDHGAWVPLKLSFPDADVPVTQLSIQPSKDARWHYDIGRALRPLREEGVLVLGTGALTHNLAAFRGQALDAPAPAWVSDFAEWVRETAEAQRIEDLLAWPERAPNAAANHPTDEHFLPFFVALGAASDGGLAERLHASVTYGVLAMDVYRFH